MVSVNLLSLLCDGSGVATASSMGNIMRFGGPIVYLIVYSCILLTILVWVDSGSVLPRILFRKKPASPSVASFDSDPQGVAAETQETAMSKDLLRILSVSKSFNGKKVVDDVSLGVSRDTVFAMLGPNGAGKTTTFNLIREPALTF